MLGAMAVAAFAGAAGAQTSATTTCMMTCNSQAASCQSACLLPPSPTRFDHAAAPGGANPRRQFDREHVVRPFPDGLPFIPQRFRQL